VHLWQREILILITSSATTEWTLRATGGLGVHLGIRARFLPKADLAERPPKEMPGAGGALAQRRRIHHQQHQLMNSTGNLLCFVCIPKVSCDSLSLCKIAITDAIIGWSQETMALPAMPQHR